MKKLFNTITNREAVIWGRILKESEDPEETLDNIITIDQMLTLQKNKALLNKKRGLTKDLKNLIAKKCGAETINLSNR